MHRGYVKLWRRSWEHPFYNENRPATKREAWEDVLAMVNHKKEMILIGNKMVECDRGQSVRSLENWGREWKWSRHKVRDFFLLCQKLSQITYENLTQTVRITVCNYDTYNDTPNEIETEKERIGNASGTHRDTNKNDKNEKNITLSNERVGVKKFTPPTIDEVSRYCESRNNGIEAQRFLDYYQSRGWMIGKNKMRDWMAAVRTWEGRRRDETQQFEETRALPIT